MRIVKVLVLLFVLSVLRAPIAQAQICLGLPAFGAASVHVNFAGEFPDSASLLAAGVGGGRDNHVFGNIGGGSITYEGLDQKTTFGFFEAGWQLPLGRLQLCPLASVYLGFGPNDDDIGLDTESRGLAGGIALGTAYPTRYFALAPNVAVRYSVDEVTVTEENIGSARETFTGGVVDLGLGFIIRDRLSIQPILHIPFASDDVDRSIGIFAAYRFNWTDW